MQGLYFRKSKPFAAWQDSLCYCSREQDSDTLQWLQWLTAAAFCKVTTRRYNQAVLCCRLCSAAVLQSSYIYSKYNKNCTSAQFAKIRFLTVYAKTRSTFAKYYSYSHIRYLLKSDQYSSQFSNHKGSKSIRFYCYDHFVQTIWLSVGRNNFHFMELKLLRAQYFHWIENCNVLNKI